MEQQEIDHSTHLADLNRGWWFSATSMPVGFAKDSPPFGPAQSQQ